LRRATAAGRAGTAARAQPAKLSEVDKGLLDKETEMLGEVRKRMFAMDENGQRAKDPDRYSRLQNEEFRIRKRMEAIGRRATAPGAAPAPAGADQDPPPGLLPPEQPTAPTEDDPLGLGISPD